MNTGEFRVALITMPFFPVTHPCIQIGLLHAIGEAAGFQVDSFHLNLHMAARLKPKYYDALSKHRGHMTSEWLFAKTAFGKPAASCQDYFATFPDEIKFIRKLGVPPSVMKKIHYEIAPRFVNECMRLTEWGKYSVIGFSSIFQQNVASLALARRIKSRYPHVKILFGGANMEGEMGPEYLRAFDFIDYVCTGEGDLLFPALLKSLREGNSIENIAGLAYRVNGAVKVNAPAPPFQNMDSLPMPNYDEYFVRLKKLKLSLKSDFLLLETARGCWWGEKHHCTFCGLNGLNMKFRAKSISRVLEELFELSSRYGIFWFSPTDNILDLKYLRELFVLTEKLNRNYRFSWEIKANLTREQIRTMYLGGMRHLQPGIESLSSPILKLMRKGCTMLQNLLTLKWCRYYDIQVAWNLLYGFPGEVPEDYEQELAVMKLISHLQPPYSTDRIWLERFAPYYFDRDSFPIRNIHPDSSYALVYPPTVSLDKIAYFFEYEMEATVPEEVHENTKKLIEKWIQAWKTGRADTLTFRRKGSEILIHDRRALLKTGTALGVHKFTEPEASIYEFCSDTYRSLNQVVAELKNRTAYTFDAEPVLETLNSFCKRGFMVGEDGKYLSLALPEPVDLPWQV